MILISLRNLILLGPALCLKTYTQRPVGDRIVWTFRIHIVNFISEVLVSDDGIDVADGKIDEHQIFFAEIKWIIAEIVDGGPGFGYDCQVKTIGVELVLVLRTVATRPNIRDAEDSPFLLVEATI